MPEAYDGRLNWNLVVALLFLAPASALTQITGTVRGVVRDSATGNPIASALVSVKELPSLYSTSESDGKYEIRGFPVGSFTLLARRIGYSTASDRITISSASREPVSHDLFIANQSVELEQVVTSAVAQGPRSAWVGAQVAYNLGDVGNLTDNFLASGDAVLDILGDEEDSINGYIMGNLSRLDAVSKNDGGEEAAQLQLRKLQQSAQGVQVAIVPNWFRGDPKDRSLAIWASVGWKVNALRSRDDSVRYLNQGRLGLGTQVTAFRAQRAGLPLSFGIEAWSSFFSEKTYAQVFGTSKSSLYGLDLSLIVPAGAGRGVLAESTVTAGAKPAVRVGLLLTSGDLDKAAR